MKTLIRPLSFLTSKQLLLFYFVCFFIFDCYLRPTDFSSDFFIILYLTFAYLKLSFNDSMNQLFHYVGECSVRSKLSAVLTLINQLHTNALFKRCSVKQRCSSNCKKSLKTAKYLKISLNELICNKNAVLITGK